MAKLPPLDSTRYKQITLKFLLYVEKAGCLKVLLNHQMLKQNFTAMFSIVSHHLQVIPFGIYM